MVVVKMRATLGADPSRTQHHRHQERHFQVAEIFAWRRDDGIRELETRTSCDERIDARDYPLLACNRYLMGRSSDGQD
jgi:hypothetical protein